MYLGLWVVRPWPLLLNLLLHHLQIILVCRGKVLRLFQLLGGILGREGCLDDFAVLNSKVQDLTAAHYVVFFGRLLQATLLLCGGLTF